MNAREPFSDATLERMLVRRAHRAEPGDLRAEVFASIESTEPRRPLWPTWQLPPLGRVLRPQPLMLAVTLLLLALLAGALAAGAGWLRQHRSPPIELTPTGIEVMTPGDRTWAGVVEDGTGTQWAIGTGVVTRFDPGSGAHRTWTLADDAAFAAWPTTPARAGGLWIWAGDSILRFTGDLFAESIPAPGSPGLLDEAPDGTLWASPGYQGLVRWDGAHWVPAPPSEIPAEQVMRTILACASDDVWVATSDPNVPGTPAVVAHLEGDRWTMFDWIGDPTQTPDWLAEGADGSIWATRHQAQGLDELVRLSDGRWEVIDGPVARLNMANPVVAPDGSIWTTLFDNNGATIVARYDQGHWTTYRSSDGLVGSTIGGVSATSAGVFVGTDQGLLRYQGGRWTPVWSSVATPSEIYGPGGTFVGVSADEAWLADMRGVWHYAGGSWSGPIEPPGLGGSQVTGLALADDGSLWVATVTGAAVLKDGTWSAAWDEEVLSIDLAPDGSVWVGDFGRIVHLTPTASGFQSKAVACPMPAITLTVAIDGSVWVGGFSYSGKAGLAHFDGTTCDEVDLRADPTRSTTVEVSSIVADPDGGVVIEALEGMYDASGDYVPDATLGVFRLADGARTDLFGPGPVVSSSFGALAIAPDGQLWWAREGLSSEPAADAIPGAGLARFDGQQWVQVLSGVAARGPIAVAPDGTVWFQGAPGLMRLPAAAAAAP